MDKKLDQKARYLNIFSDSYLLVTCFGASLTSLSMRRLDAITFFFFKILEHFRSHYRHVLAFFIKFFVHMEHSYNNFLKVKH